MVAVRMPGRVADVVVAVARFIVEIRTQKSGSQAFDALVVEQGAQIGVLVDKGQQGRAPRW